MSLTKVMVERRGRVKEQRSAVGRREPEGGAALVEFAVILPLLFALLFGIVEFGLGFNDYQSIRQGVREGGRQAVVREYGSTPTGCTTITAPDEVKQVICLTKDRIGIGNDVRVLVRYFDVSGAAGDNGSVRVCAQRNLKPVTKFIPAIDGIVLRSRIEMRMEKPIAAGISKVTPYAEGEGWTWCTGS